MAASTTSHNLRSDGDMLVSQTAPGQANSTSNMHADGYQSSAFQVHDNESSTTMSEGEGVHAVPIIQPVARKAPPAASRISSPQVIPDHTPSSPPNRVMYSSSPRLASPAGSQIFERDVQQSSSLPGPSSPAIPAHIKTENHIPPVLDASSEAITDTTIDPDTVEIVMHSLHQPAAIAMGGMSADSLASSWQDPDIHMNSLAAHDLSETASNYGSLDTTDVRRLSFISFADVVQSEHAEQQGNNRESIHVAGLTALSSPSLNRSPSPVCSPGSSLGLGTSPPTSKCASVKGMDMSPVRKPLPTQIGTGAPGLERSDLTVETMTQALRKTGSGDFSSIKSRPLSPKDSFSPGGVAG